MNELKRYQLLLWSANEYYGGYEFPIWKNDKWEYEGQFKLDFWIT